MLEEYINNILDHLEDIESLPGIKVKVKLKDGGGSSVTVSRYTGDKYSNKEYYFKEILKNIGITEDALNSSNTLNIKSISVTPMYERRYGSWGVGN